MIKVPSIKNRGIFFEFSRTPAEEAQKERERKVDQIYLENKDLKARLDKLEKIISSLEPEVNK